MALRLCVVLALLSLVPATSDGNNTSTAGDSSSAADAGDNTSMAGDDGSGVPGDDDSSPPAASPTGNAGSSSGSDTSWVEVSPQDDCRAQGLYFDPTVQRCRPCNEVSAHAQLIPDVAARDLSAGAAGQCTCKPGFVQCAGGERCLAGTDAEFQAEGIFECRACPKVGGRQTAPTEDRTHCMPCSDSSTLGYSKDVHDCLCPGGHALLERKDSGAHLPAKKCVECASGMNPGPLADPAAVYHCAPCPDPERMERDPSTGKCLCRSKAADGRNFVAQGGECIAVDDYNLVNDRFSVAAAQVVTYRDLIDGRESMFEHGPFGHDLGIAIPGDNTMDVLRLDDTTRVDISTVSSGSVEWLYMRCAVDCYHQNATACECVSNLCALMLYDDTATVCRFLTNFLYEGREVIHLSPSGMGLQGMPWLFYSSQRADEILSDTSVSWKFSLANNLGGRRDTTNMLTFWLASYSLEGSWLGWERLGSQLDLCATLGGTSVGPQSPSHAWRRFASSLTSACTVPLANILKCGANPVLYDLFIENPDRTLVPVPVRILNLIKDQVRPNLNFDTSVWKNFMQDHADDVLVRRFLLCDAVSGRAGGPEAFLDPGQLPVVFRWAAHMAVEIRARHDAEGQIYVPVLSIAYAEKKTANLEEDSVTHVTFKAEYSMGAKTYWTVMVVFICLVCALIVVWAGVRVFLVDRRYPSMPLLVPGGDLNLFMPKLALQALAFFSSGLAALFWFHFVMAMYWLIFFKAQDAPHLLLPSGFYGDQYQPHDVLMVVVLCTGVICVSLDLWRHLKVFIFLIDWERGEPLPLPGAAGGQRLPDPMSLQQQQQGMHQHAAGQISLLGPGSSPQMVGSPLLGQQPAGHLQGHQEGSSSEGLVAFPDSGVSAWRTLFVCNQLNERLSSTRMLPHVTWLVMVGLLEGLGWKNAARWYPRFAGDEGMLTAQFNPFIQFALGTSLWLAVLIAQLVLRRIASIFFGSECHDFVDVCSVANVSVLFLDEPYHGYYIHGKAPSSRGDWCHSELAKVLHDEDKGIGLTRGLTPDGCQTFEMYLPPDLSVSVPGGPPAHLRQALCQIFGGVNATLQQMAMRRPLKPEPVDIAEMSLHRCRVQALMDSLVHAVMRKASEVVQARSAMNWFWGALPSGGVAALRQPVFYQDLTGLAWLSCLAYGSELRLAGVGFPTGFEWHLGLVELMAFHMCWRFQGSIYLASAVAFILNQAALGLYAYVGRLRLAHTTVISSTLLFGGRPRTQGLVYFVVAVAFLIHEAAA